VWTLDHRNLNYAVDQGWEAVSINLLLSDFRRSLPPCAFCAFISNMPISNRPIQPTDVAEHLLMVEIAI
jgi:hypothetical protein